jgi:ribosomal-protein-alanine N-acetyltransferase
MTVRALTAADIPAIAALEQQGFPDPWNEAGLSLLLTPPYGGLCAEENGILLGYVGWIFFPADGDLPADAEITRITVSPDARRRGIGLTLLRAMCAVLLPACAPLTVRLDVRESNLPAQALYAAHGFAPCGRRPRFYGNEDALEFILTVPPKG